MEEDTVENLKGQALPAGSPIEEFRGLVASVRTYLPETSIEPLEKAFAYASTCHKEQTRRSGEPYITHPIQVAQLVAQLGLDMSSIVAAILHDTVEDTSATLDDIREMFGDEVCQLVDGLTKIAKIKFRSTQERLAENFRKMILAMAKDLRVILIKLCDRLHNMRTIEALPAEKGRRIAQETMDIYAPLANRLGIYGIKSELEDLCLRTLKREVYTQIRAQVAAKKSERQSFIDEVKSILENELKKYGFKNITVYGRPKHFYSIYKKMKERELDFEDIHDLFAFRIIVPSLKDCYEALGVVHAMWKPMPGRFKDYIAMPKANMYQSLHTTVVRPNGEPCEIQIRTREMQDVCEFGIAAHWAYKEKELSPSLGQEDLQKFSWLRQIVQWQSELKDPDEFLEAVKVDLFDEEIFCFTPKGDVLSLPKGATALDFAFAVHTDVGLRTIGTKVNGRMVPIKRRLNSGDIVEVLTSPNQKPSKDWLTNVKTSKARNKIRSHLRHEQRAQSLKLGQDLFSQELERVSLSLEQVKKQGLGDKFVKAARESSLDDVLIGIGYGRINAGDLVAKVFPPEQPRGSMTDQVDSVNLDAIQRGRNRPRKKGRSGILVSGEEDVLMHFARCCSPLPGEQVIGFVTRGRGVTVHRADCARALDLDPERKVEVSWEEGFEHTTSHLTSLKVLTQDKPGVLAEVTQIVANCGADIKRADVRVSGDMTGSIDFEIGVRDLVQLETVVQKLENLRSVVRVDRKGLPGLKKKVTKLGRKQ